MTSRWKFRTSGSGRLIGRIVMPRCLCVLAWVLLVTVTAHAERLPIRVDTVEDGLAHARVRRIVRDPRGLVVLRSVFV